jgi:hypothetical protein
MMLMLMVRVVSSSPMGRRSGLGMNAWKPHGGGGVMTIEEAKRHAKSRARSAPTRSGTPRAS